MEYKKLFIILGVCVSLVVLPTILLSTPMMGCYQGKIDENPNSDSSRDWQFKLAKTCANTLRPDLAADMYERYIDRYKKDEKRAEAMWRRAQCLVEAEKVEEGKEQYRVLILEYPKDAYALQADDLLKLRFNDYKRYPKGHVFPKKK